MGDCGGIAEELMEGHGREHGPQDVEHLSPIQHFDISQEKLLESVTQTLERARHTHASI